MKFEVIQKPEPEPKPKPDYNTLELWLTQQTYGTADLISIHARIKGSPGIGQVIASIGQRGIIAHRIDNIGIAKTEENDRGRTKIIS